MPHIYILIELYNVEMHVLMSLLSSFTSLCTSHTDSVAYKELKQPIGTPSRY